MPLPVTHDKHLSSLPDWHIPKDKLADAKFTFRDSRLVKYEVKECNANYHCVDSAPEFVIPSMDTVDIQRVDVILISNHLQMFALPYITERLGYTGSIYVTEPTFYFGRIMMEELIMLIERAPKPRRSDLWKRIYDMCNLSIPKNHKMNSDPNSWLQIYSMKELNSCLSKLKLVRFCETVDIFGLFEISAHSSGYCIGSCNWVLNSNHQKIVYMSQTCMLTTHTRPFDSTPLIKADVLMVTNLTSSPMIDPDMMLTEFCSKTIQALRNGGNVLVPTYPCGVVYDLIECLTGQLTSANLNQVMIYFISPVAETSLAYSNILGEWLTKSRSDKLYEPDEPFIHSKLVRIGRLKYFSSITDAGFNENFKTPCVVFTSHPSLRFGDVVHFIQFWGQSSRNLLILTEADFPWQEAVNPYLPLSMRILYNPMDTNWNFKQANAVLNDLKPTNLVIHQDYAKIPDFYANVPNIPQTDIMIEAPSSIIDTNKNLAPMKSKPKISKLLTYPYLGSISIPLIKVAYERLSIESSLASQIIQSEIRPGVSFATINGSLFARDNKYILFPVEEKKSIGVLKKTNIAAIEPLKQNYYGNVNFQMLMDMFVKNGMTVATVDPSRGGKIVNLQSPRAIIHLEEGETNIIAPDQKARALLLEIVRCCLKKF